jgi:hypothetical protein
MKRAQTILFAVLALTVAALLAGCETEVVPPPQAPSPAPPSAPWQAAIGELDTGMVGIHCSAVLVRPDLIATASHCLFLSTSARPTPPDWLIFNPNMGERARFAPSRGVVVEAMGAQVRSGHIRNQDVPVDWALVQISPPVRGVHPIPVAAMSLDQILSRIRSGDRLVTLGYGNGALDVQKEHDECRLLSPGELGLRPDDSWMQLDCVIRIGDSGGAILLLDGGNRPRLVGLLAGFGKKPQTTEPIAVGVNAANFAPYIGQPVAGLDPFSVALLAALPAD